MKRVDENLYEMNVQLERVPPDLPSPLEKWKKTVTTLKWEKYGTKENLKRGGEMEPALI